MESTRSNAPQPGLRRTAIASLASYAVPVLIGLVAMPILFRLLGASRFGVFSIALLTPAIAVSLDLGLTSAAIRRLATELDQPGDTLGSALGSYAFALAIIGVALGAAIALAAPSLSDLLGFSAVIGSVAGAELIRLCGLWAALSLVVSLPGIILRARQRFAALALVQTLATLVLWLAALTLVALGASVFLVIVVAMVTTAASAAVCLVLVRQEIPDRIRLRADPSLVLNDARFSFGLFLLQLSNVLAFQLDRAVVSALVSPAAAGIYALCVGIANKTLFGIAALTSFAYPRAAAMWRRDEHAEIARFLQAMQRVALVLIAPVVLPAVFLSGPFLMLWLGEGPSGDTVRLLQLLWCGYAIAAVCAPATHVITGTGTSRLAAVFAWMTAIVLIGSMFLLLPRIGLLGAGIANVLAMSTSLMFLAIVRRQLDVQPDPERARLTGGIACASAVQVLLLVLALPFVLSWGVFLLVGAASVAVYEMVRWAMRSLTGEEVRLIHSLVSWLRRGRAAP